MSVPGKATLAVSQLAMVTDRVLELPPLTRRDVLVKSVIGSNPVVYAQVGAIGYDEIYLTVTGQLELSGVGNLKLW
jgi:hypothetical protein